MKVFLFVSLWLYSALAIAGNKMKNECTAYDNYIETFELVSQVPCTDVKDQDKTGTCWSFCGISFLESELIRMGKGSFDLSEMYVVRYGYLSKAEKYIRMHGKSNFTSGGEANDVLDVVSEAGIVPEEIYTGLDTNQQEHFHFRMDTMLDSYVDSIVALADEKPVDSWKEEFNTILDTFLGLAPDSFFFGKNQYTPSSFYKDLDINTDDYIVLTSFSHHPFYNPFILEVPDNWSWKEAYNLPLQEFEQVIDSAIMNGYSLAWAGDISEDGFDYKHGLAVAPEFIYRFGDEQQRDKWNSKTTGEKDSILFKTDSIYKELEVDQAIRQEAFDNMSTTDDHGMHLIGIARDKDGKKYYYFKNSWGTNNLLKGRVYLSDAYLKYKTISVMTHKDALPKDLREKLNL